MLRSTILYLQNQLKVLSILNSILFLAYISFNSRIILSDLTLKFFNFLIILRLYIASYILIYYDTILYHLLFIFIRYYIVYLFLLYVFFIRPLFNLSLKVSYWNKFKREICRQATWHFPQFTLDAITGQVYCILARRDERELGEFCSWSFGIELLRGKRNATGKCVEGRGVISRQISSAFESIQPSNYSSCRSTEKGKRGISGWIVSERKHGKLKRRKRAPWIGEQFRMRTTEGKILNWG